jgi:hypothetical protein
MIVLNCAQGSEDWLRARIGACTASRFSDARERVGGLTEQQATYVKALQSGATEAAARLSAGYKNAPRAGVIDRALAGQPVDEPGSKAIAYAALIAVETVAREPLDDTFVTYAMRRGRELEPYGRSKYEVRTGAVVEEVSLILTDDERFGYSADGFVDDDGLIEIKCPMAPAKIMDVWTNPGSAHLEYIDQINGGLWISGRKWCDLVVYCPWLAPVGKDLFVKRIYRDEAAIEALEADLIRFIQMVDANLQVLRTPTKMSGAPKDGLTTAPSPNDSRDCADTLSPAPIEDADWDDAMKQMENQRPTVELSAPTF